MAIYHLEAKVVSRGTGRSAVAASAYMSCSRLYNDYDGIQHDYTRKQGLIYNKVFPLDLSRFALQRMMQVCEDCDAAMVYSDYYENKNNQMSAHPVTDYQEG